MDTGHIVGWNLGSLAVIGGIIGVIGRDDASPYVIVAAGIAGCGWVGIDAICTAIHKGRER